MDDPGQPRKRDDDHTAFHWQPQALGILYHLRAITGNGKLVFPCVRTILRPISENTFNAGLRRIGYRKDEATAHGFRATASTLSERIGKWNPDAIDANCPTSKVTPSRRAYARGEHWDERVRMMTWWADYLDSLKGWAPSSEFMNGRPA